MGYISKVTIATEDDEFSDSSNSNDLEIHDAGNDGVLIGYADDQQISIFINRNDWPLIRKTINAFMKGTQS